MSIFFFFSSRRRHTRYWRDWSSDVCSSDLPVATELLTATGQLFVVAPAERRSSAEQGALMFREGPRLVADACESTDWSHVDVYLTKPLDYRALLFAGSRGDAELLRWTTERGPTVRSEER